MYLVLRNTTSYVRSPSVHFRNSHLASIARQSKASTHAAAPPRRPSALCYATCYVRRHAVGRSVGPLLVTQFRPAWPGCCRFAQRTQRETKTKTRYQRGTRLTSCRGVSLSLSIRRGKIYGGAKKSFSSWRHRSVGRSGATRESGKPKKGGSSSQLPSCRPFSRLQAAAPPPPPLQRGRKAAAAAAGRKAIDLSRARGSLAACLPAALPTYGLSRALHGRTIRTPR